MAVGYVQRYCSTRGGGVVSGFLQHAGALFVREMRAGGEFQGKKTSARGAVGWLDTEG